MEKYYTLQPVGDTLTILPHLFATQAQLAALPRVESRPDIYLQYVFDMKLLIDDQTGYFAHCNHVQHFGPEKTLAAV